MADPGISLAIVCPSCGRTGMVTWRENRNGSTPVACHVVRLSDGFRVNGRDTDSGDTQVVCEGCGSVVPG